MDFLDPRGRITVTFLRLDVEEWQSVPELGVPQVPLSRSHLPTFCPNFLLLVCSSLTTTVGQGIAPKLRQTQNIDQKMEKGGNISITNLNSRNTEQSSQVSVLCCMKEKRRTVIYILISWNKFSLYTASGKRKASLN